MYLEIKMECNDIVRPFLRDITKDFRDIHSLNRKLLLLKVAATGYAQMRMTIPHGIARRPQLEILDVCLVRGWSPLQESRKDFVENGDYCLLRESFIVLFDFIIPFCRVKNETLRILVK